VYVAVTPAHPILPPPAQSGLQLEDKLLSINGTPLGSSLEAAKVLRESTGDIWLCVERSLSEPQEPGAETENGEAEDVLDTARQDIADLDFLQDRLKTHEDNLLQRQEETAGELERVMRECEPPTQLSDAEMMDSEKVSEFMMLMGAYSAKQQMGLEDHAKVVEENQMLSRQLSEVAQIKRWMQDTAQWLASEIDCFEEGHESGESPPMLSEEDIEYMELVDEQLYELLEAGGEEGEEQDEADEQATEEHATGVEVEAAPVADPPPSAEEVQLAQPAQPVSAAVRRSNSFSRRAGANAKASAAQEATKASVVLEEETDKSVAPATVRRSNSFSRRKGVAEAKATSEAVANAETAAKPASGEQPAKAGVRRANSFSRRKNLGADVMDEARRDRLIAQRLGRARKSSTSLIKTESSASLIKTGSEDDSDEIGVQIHPM
jgi:hypothetical protein